MNRRNFLKASLMLWAGSHLTNPLTALAAPRKELIVDMHCHILTSKDLAVRGFIRRHAAHGGIPKWIVKAAIKLIDLFEKKEKGTADLGAVAKPYRDFLNAVEQKDELPDDIAERIFQVETAENDVELGPLGKQTFKNTVSWVFLMLKRPSKVLEIMAKTYPEVRFFTPMMVDFDGWVDSDRAQYSTERQIQNFEDIILAYTREASPSNTGAPYVHPIVSFNPLKAVPSAGYSRNDADNYINLVQSAVLRRGFVGVKIYPPAGFRATQNDNDSLMKVVDEPYRRATLAEEIDTVVDDLLLFCSDNGVPVAAHCTPTGAQSSPEHKSGLNADPYYWYLALSTGKYPGLRLNLNHFGKNSLGDQTLSIKKLRNDGYPTGQPWSACIAWMMNRFPGQIFADIGFFTFEDSEYKDIFRAVFSEFPEQMATQLMYGSDWHMLRQNSSYKNYLKKQSETFRKLFREAISDQDAAAQAYRNFMGLNALRFLGISETQGGYRRLNCYYGNVLNHRSPTWAGAYSPPGWFTDDLPWECAQG